MKALLAGVALLVAASGASAAQEPGWYIGIGGGPTSLSNVCNYYDSVGLGFACDDESVGAKVFVGMPLTANLGFEFELLDAGEARVAFPPATPGTVDVNPLIFTTFIKYEVPFGLEDRFRLFAKAGFFSYKTEYKRTGSFSTLGDEESGMDTAIGGGVIWRGWDKISVRVE